MAADTKRWWATRDLASHLHNIDVTTEDLRAVLEAQGLHVVTAAEKAVLDACAAFSFSYWEGRGPGISGDDLKRVIDAELTRREAAK